LDVERLVRMFVLAGYEVLRLHPLRHVEFSLGMPASLREAVSSTPLGLASTLSTIYGWPRTPPTKTGAQSPSCGRRPWLGHRCAARAG
jgi:hypothetical protein